jgi:hypothetical protein
MSALATTDFQDRVDQLRSAVSPDALLARAGCTDEFLDLYTATDDPAVREVIGEFLGRTVGRTLLEGREVLDALALVSAAADVEAAFAPLLLPEA